MTILVITLVAAAQVEAQVEALAAALQMILGNMGTCLMARPLQCSTVKQVNV